MALLGMNLNRLFIVLGGILIVVGLAWPWINQLPWFRLPGDIVVDRPGFKFFFPITTMLLISAAVSIVLWLMRK